MTICPHCSYQHDSTSMVAERDGGDYAGPEDGDVTLCIRCGEWCVFEADELRRPTAAEYRELESDRRCRTTKAAWQRVRGLQ